MARPAASGARFASAGSIRGPDRGGCRKRIADLRVDPRVDFRVNRSLPPAVAAPQDRASGSVANPMSGRTADGKVREGNPEKTRGMDRETSHEAGHETGHRPADRVASMQGAGAKATGADRGGRRNTVAAGRRVAVGVDCRHAVDVDRRLAGNAGPRQVANAHRRPAGNADLRLAMNADRRHAGSAERRLAASAGRRHAVHALDRSVRGGCRRLPIWVRRADRRRGCQVAQPAVGVRLVDRAGRGEPVSARQRVAVVRCANGDRGRPEGCGRLGDCGCLEGCGRPEGCAHAGGCGHRRRCGRFDPRAPGVRPGPAPASADRARHCRRHAPEVLPRPAVCRRRRASST